MEKVNPNILEKAVVKLTSLSTLEIINSLSYLHSPVNFCDIIPPNVTRYVHEKNKTII